jgi:hypothetical protein
MTATAFHTSQRENAYRAAEDRAAKRRASAAAVREAARTRRALEHARAWVTAARSEGAVQIGVAVTNAHGTFRATLPLEDAPAYLAYHHDAEVEALGIDAAGEFVGEEW